MTRDTWRSWPADYPKRTLALTIVLAILSVAGILRLRPDTSIERLFPQDSPAAQSLVKVLKDFSAAEELLVLASLPDSKTEGPPEVDRLLAFAERFDRSVKASPTSHEFTTGIIYQADEQTKAFFENVLVPAGLFYLDDASFAAAKKRLTREEMDRQFRQNEALIAAPGPAAQALAKAFLQDPLRLHEFIMKPLEEKRPIKTYGNRDAFLAPNGRSLLIRIPGNKPPSDLNFARRFTQFVTEQTSRANTDGLVIDLSGAYPIAARSEQSIRADMTESVISSAVFLQVLFLIVYRRPIRSFLLAFVPVVIGIGYGFGAQSLVSTSLTPLIAVVGAILAGIGIDYTIHYLAQYDAAVSRGLNPRAAARDTIQTIGGAQLAGWVTSVIGFFAVGWSSIPALRDFAIVGSLGLAGSFIGSVMILPALLQVLTPRRSASEAVSRYRGSILPTLHRISRWRKSVLLVGISILAISVGILAIAQEVFPFENDLKVMHPEPNPPLEAQQKIAERMGTSPGSMILHLQAASPEELVLLAHQVDERLRTPSVRDMGITGTYGLATLLPDPRVAVSRIAATGEAYAERVITDFRAVVVESVFDPDRLKPYETFLRFILTRTEPPGMHDLVRYPSLAGSILPRSAFDPSVKGPSESIVLVFTAGSLDERSNRERAISAVRSSIVDLHGATLTGLGVLSHDTEQTIRRNLPRLFGISLGAVLVYMFLHFRSLVDPLLALLPALFSLVVLAAAMQVAGQKINLMNLISVPLLIGIDVDYGIFVVTLARLQRIRREDEPTALRNLAASMHANVLCASATILGFGSLVTTSVPAIRSLGFAVGVGVAACLVGTFTLLFPLVLMFNRRAAMRSEGKT